MEKFLVTGLSSSSSSQKLQLILPKGKHFEFHGVKNGEADLKTEALLDIAAKRRKSEASHLLLGFLEICQELCSIFCQDTPTHSAKAQSCSRWTCTLRTNINTNCVQHRPGQSQMYWLPRPSSVTMSLSLVTSGVQECQGWLHWGQMAWWGTVWLICQEDFPWLAPQVPWTWVLCIPAFSPIALCIALAQFAQIQKILASGCAELKFVQIVIPSAPGMSSSYRGFSQEHQITSRWWPRWWTSTSMFILMLGYL